MAVLIPPKVTVKAVLAALIAKFTEEHREEEEIVAQAQQAEVIVAVWVVDARQENRGVEHAVNLTGLVKVRLQGDITCPDGGPGPITGTIRISNPTPWTNPPPPGPAIMGDYPSDAEGEVSITLSKGFDYKVEVIIPPTGYAPPAPVTVRVPQLGEPPILTCTLQVLMVLKVYTYDQNGPIQALVKLQKQVNGQWVDVQESTSELEDPNAPPAAGQNEYVATFGFVPPGEGYRLKAISYGPPGEGVTDPFIIRRGCEAVKTVVLQTQSPSPPPEEGGETPPPDEGGSDLPPEG
jgi:hypothetical protein